ncbi:nucleoside-diphosphate kinase [Planctomycetota bacterium]
MKKDIEQTLVIFKPDAVHRGLIGRITSRFEEKGLQITGLKMIKISDALAAEHYAVHKGKPFYQALVTFMTASPVVVMALRGVNAVAISRKMMGATFGPDADPGTIRGDFGVSKGFNLVHGSDSPEIAREELARFFKPEELMDYSLITESWLYDEEDFG